MDFTEEDKRLLEDLGLSNIPDEDKQVLLDSIDDSMSKRFIVNLLTSLPEDKRGELEEKVEAMKDEDPQKVIEAIIDLHPDAKDVLVKSAQEIMDELKQAKANGSLPGQPAAASGSTPGPTAQPETSPAEPAPADSVASSTGTPEPQYYSPDAAASGNEAPTISQPLTQSPLDKQIGESPIEQSEDAAESVPAADSFAPATPTTGPQLTTPAPDPVVEPPVAEPAPTVSPEPTSMPEPTPEPAPMAEPAPAPEPTAAIEPNPGPMPGTILPTPAADSFSQSASGTLESNPVTEPSAPTNSTELTPEIPEPIDPTQPTPGFEEPAPAVEPPAPAAPADPFGTPQASTTPQTSPDPNGTNTPPPTPDA